MIIVGMDEVGRGCWAGPLVVGAVILDQPIDGLTDSKLLTKKSRERLSKLIKQSAIACGLGWVTPKEVDELGLTAATTLACERALTEITVEYDEIVIDGHFNFLPNNLKSKTLIKADLKVPCVSAASILAKVARDNYMVQIAADFPDHKFESHVGYGTKLHKELLKLHGVTNIHRLSYKPIKLLLAND